MTARHLIAWAFLIAVPFFSQAQTAKYSNEFLSVGIGARSFGMANATVGHVDDVTSGYWNPAGLSHLPAQYELGAMHAEYFTGIAKYDYLGGAWAVDSTQHVAASLIRFGVDNIPNTTELIDQQGNIDYDRISYFSAADYALLLSYSRKSNLPGLSFGGNVKIIHRNIGKFASSWGFGIDLGVQYRHQNWFFGGIIRDATTTFNAWSFNEQELIVETGDSTFNFAPEQQLELTLPKVILGAGHRIYIAEDFSALVEVNFDVHTDGRRHSLIRSDAVSIDPHAGAEISYNRLIYLRMGVGNFQQVKDIRQRKQISYQPNLGVGIHYKGFTIDYALTDIGDQSTALYSNIFTLKYAFDPKE
jgi:hypothetical protein